MARVRSCSSGEQAPDEDGTLTSARATATAGDRPISWSAVKRSINRPYPVTIPMVLLVSLVPFYLVIADRAKSGTVNIPELALDRLIPVVPAWSLVYGALYAFLILLPVLALQQRDLIRRAVWAYLTVWIVSYVIFLLYPTAAPRPENVVGDGFGVWGLNALYGADPPYNCFPSIHVAHSFVSALALYRVHRGLGVFSTVCAALVAISTLFTKQHYVADAIGGIALAFAAYRIFLHGHSRATISHDERRVAPMLALCVGAIALAGMMGFWVFYQILT